MPRKAKTPRQSFFEVVGGSYNGGNNTPGNNTQQQGHAYTQQGQPVSAGFVTPEIDLLTGFVTALNGNPYMIGVAYLCINLGGRYLSLELTKQQEAFLAHKALRPIILFSVLFIATRNLAVAFWCTLGVLAVLWIFANENHIMCLIPGWRSPGDSKDHDASYESNMKLLQGKNPEPPAKTEEPAKQEQPKETSAATTTT